MQKFIDLQSALNSLKNSTVIVVPTDTIPGLACDASNEAAIKKIYEIKSRDENKTFPLLFHSIEHVKEFLEITSDEIKLANKFWPGGLTLVLTSKGKLPQILENSAGKIGARIPANEDTRNLIKKLGKPIVATSINITGEENITNIENIPAEISSKIAGILAGNYASLGKASTVAEIIGNEIKIYREGALNRNNLEEELKK